MKIDKETDEFKDFKVKSVSKDTDHRYDLFNEFFPLIRDTVEYEQISVSPFSYIPSDAGLNRDDVYWSINTSKQLLEELTHVINLYTPYGYYFGEHPDEKLNYGFWKKERSCPLFNTREEKIYYEKAEVFCHSCKYCDQKEYHRMDRHVHLDMACKHEENKRQ